MNKEWEGEMYHDAMTFLAIFTRRELKEREGGKVLCLVCCSDAGGFLWPGVFFFFKVARLLFWVVFRDGLHGGV